MNNSLWLKCSAVAVAFYVILYFFLGQYYGYANPWLLIILLVLVVSDIWVLRWWIDKGEKEGPDDYS